MGDSPEKHHPAVQVGSPAPVPDCPPDHKTKRGSGRMRPPPPVSLFSCPESRRTRLPPTRQSSKGKIHHIARKSSNLVNVNGGFKFQVSGFKLTANGQRPTANGQRPTANGQRPTANGVAHAKARRRKGRRGSETAKAGRGNNGEGEKLAERQGFEPWVPLRVHTLSKRTQSAALAPLRPGKTGTCTSGSIREHIVCWPHRQAPPDGVLRLSAGFAPEPIEQVV
jgi:hypothetical protein